MGLGYPTLNRYDPRTAEGLSDTLSYYQIVLNQPSERPRADIFRCRILVPYVAKPVYWLARSRLHTWQPVVFALLVASSLFCATTALVLSNIGSRVAGETSIGLLAATLYLLNFAVPNLQLAGLIDSGESCFLLAVVWALLARKWWALPLLGILGPLAKETFVPFASVMMIVWWLAAERHQSSRFVSLGWIAATIILSAAALIITRLAVLGHIVWPWEIAAQMNSQSNYLFNLWRCISDRGFWYIFIWLLPLGVWRLKQLPGPWVLASACTVALAFAFGAFNNMEGTVGRPVFNIIGPLLSLSVALLLTSTKKPDAGKEAIVK